jgi:hypothetical protein
MKCEVMLLNGFPDKDKDLKVGLSARAEAMPASVMPTQ